MRHLLLELGALLAPLLQVVALLLPPVLCEQLCSSATEALFAAIRPIRAMRTSPHTTSIPCTTITSRRLSTGARGVHVLVSVEVELQPGELLAIDVVVAVAVKSEKHLMGTTAVRSDLRSSWLGRMFTLASRWSLIWHMQMRPGQVPLRNSVSWLNMRSLVCYAAATRNWKYTTVKQSEKSRCIRISEASGCW